MKKLVTAIAVAGLIGTPAFAADMAVKAPPPPPAPVYSWTGCYIGGNLGGVWENDTTTGGLSDPGAAFPGLFPGVIPATFNYDRDSGLAGGQVGCNYQLPNW